MLFCMNFEIENWKQFVYVENKAYMNVKYIKSVLEKAVMLCIALYKYCKAYRYRL